MSAPLFDAHNHLQDEWLAPHLAEIFPVLEKNNLRGAVVNGTCEADWGAVASLAQQNEWVIPSYGLHPWFIANRSPQWLEKLMEWASRSDCAIGEIGLDRWREPFDFADQQQVFREQLAIAAERNLPVTIQCLKAWGALWKIVKDAKLPECGFLLHAYGGPLEMVHGFAERGARFSFSGYFLHERKSAQREVFAQIPVDRLLVETDAPAMPLPPERREFSLPDVEVGTAINHPANLIVAYRALAEIRGMPLEELVAQVQENFRRLFGGVMR